MPKSNSIAQGSTPDNIESAVGTLKNLRGKMDSVASGKFSSFMKNKSNGLSFQTAEEDKAAEELEKRIRNGTAINVQQKHKRLHVKDGTAEVYVSKDYAVMTHNDSGFGVNSSGCLISGRLHLNSEPHNIRVNGMWVLNEQLLTTLPSTITTPIPVLNFKFPAFAEKAAAFLEVVAGM